jgi:hypothetical protein
MKINEILTEDIEQLDEVNWKKAAAAATLAGAGLFGGAQTADAQLVDPSMRSALSSVMAQKSQEEFLEKAEPQDIIKMAYYLGQMKPFYEEGWLNNKDKARYNQFEQLYDIGYKKILNAGDKIKASLEKRKGISNSKSIFDRTLSVPINRYNSWNLPGVSDAFTLYYKVVNSDDLSHLSPKERSATRRLRAIDAELDSLEPETRKLARLYDSGNISSSQKKRFYQLDAITTKLYNEYSKLSDELYGPERLPKDDDYGEPPENEKAEKELSDPPEGGGIKPDDYDKQPEKQVLAKPSGKEASAEERLAAQEKALRDAFRSSAQQSQLPQTPVSNKIETVPISYINGAKTWVGTVSNTGLPLGFGKMYLDDGYAVELEMIGRGNPKAGTYVAKKSGKPNKTITIK